MEQDSKYIFSTYKRAPIMLVKGEGVTVTDSEGMEYLDFVGGLAACPLGHGDPQLADSIARQARKLIHVSNLFHIKPQIELAKLMVENSFGDKVFFCNSGAEANEAAIKLARKHFTDQHPNRAPRIISMLSSFHGRTLAAIAATGQEIYRKGFDPITPGFSHVPFNDLQALEAQMDADVAAVIVEPIQGEGGVNMPDEGFLQGVRSLCDQNHSLLILDEVQTGMGRTGKLLAHEHYRIIPDIVTLAKGMAGGAPIGAMIALEEVAWAFQPGAHASTFGGNPLSCAAGVTVMERIIDPGFLDSVREKGKYLGARLDEIKDRRKCVVDSRGLGLMRAVELDDNEKGPRLVELMRNEGVLVNCAAGSVIRFLPPLIVENDEIDQVISTLDRSLSEIERT
jgi:predicted acetylornithine/succinylornithine family transaminase